MILTIDLSKAESMISWMHIDKFDRKTRRAKVDYAASKFTFNGKTNREVFEMQLTKQVQLLEMLLVTGHADRTADVHPNLVFILSRVSAALNFFTIFPSLTNVSVVFYKRAEGLSN
jgi:hypothetical protein